MIFTPENIAKIREGRKTETRRIWKVPHVRVGGIYRLRAGRFAPADVTNPRVRVTDLRIEALDEITSEGVTREGSASLEEFQAQWRKLHGEWDPVQHVYVVGFEVLE